MIAFFLGGEGEIFAYIVMIMVYKRLPIQEYPDTQCSPSTVVSQERHHVTHDRNLFSQSVPIVALPPTFVIVSNM